MSWVLLRVKRWVWESPRISCATVRSLREGGNLTDSKSFITVICSRRPDDLGMGLVDVLLAVCVCLAECLPPPQHWYSHEDCTFLDTPLYQVDGEAKTQAL